MNIGTNLGSMTANCRICKKCDGVVENIQWQDVYHRPQMTKDALLNHREDTGVRKGVSKAYWCLVEKAWRTSSCSDMDCCIPDKEKAIAILKEKQFRISQKMNFIEENWD